MISFEEFKEVLREKVAGSIDADVTVVTIPKNNGVGFMYSVVIRLIGVQFQNNIRLNEIRSQ